MHWASKRLLSLTVAIILFAVMVPKVGQVQVNPASPTWTGVQARAGGGHSFCDFSDAVTIVALPAVVIPVVIARVHVTEARPLIKAAFDSAEHNRPPPMI